MGFVFYDVETTGTDKLYDQVLQFAAVATDGDMVSQGTIDVSCRLMPHVVPAPGALLATGQSIDAMSSERLQTHYDMMTGVAAQLEDWSPAVFAGWNSLAFDEEMLRQALYQSLHPPYLTSWHGNGRVDVMRVARAAALLAPGALAVPTAAGGRPTFALQAMAEANGVVHFAPHRAMSDVEATLALARLIADRAPEAWSIALRFCRKASVMDFLGDGGAVGLVDMEDGEPVVIPVAVLGVDPGRTTALLVRDLRHDDAEAKRWLQEERPSWALPRHIRRVAANACPIMVPLEDVEWQMEWGDEAVCHSRADAVAADREGTGRTLAAFAYVPPARSDLLERSLHGDFYQQADLQRLRDFHAADWRGRAAAVATFDDWRLQRLAQRLVYFNAPALLGEEECRVMTERLSRRLRFEHASGREWRTLKRAEREARGLVATAGSAGRLILDEFGVWLRARQF